MTNQDEKRKDGLIAIVLIGVLAAILWKNKSQTEIKELPRVTPAQVTITYNQ